MKKWEILKKFKNQNSKIKIEDVVDILLENRGITKIDREVFLNPADPYAFIAKDVGIDDKNLKTAIKRITDAIKNEESIVIYADYDTDGITAAAIMWETLKTMGAKVMPYIPHRSSEGYGFSIKGIDVIKKEHSAKLVISVDHGITAWEKVDYAKSQGLDVIVTDHHVAPPKVPDCPLVHTTNLSGAGVAWFLAKSLIHLKDFQDKFSSIFKQEILGLAALGTIADMVPLVGVNRSIAKYGLKALNETQRPGLLALLNKAGVKKGSLTTYEISFILAPRLNAMGRLVHALDALRLLVTQNPTKAQELADLLDITNKERQLLTDENLLHAKEMVDSEMLKGAKKILFVTHEEYNQGVIGLVAGKLVESYWRPAIVLSKGEKYSKASARSITGFNIIETIRSCSDLLVDAGGHPMAAGFTIETNRIEEFKIRMEEIAEKALTEDLLVRSLRIDTELPAEALSFQLWEKMQELMPYGIGNPEPVFAISGLSIADARLVGRDNKHLKITFYKDDKKIEAIGFGMGGFYESIAPEMRVDVAFNLTMDTWNNQPRLQLKLKDMHIQNNL